MLIEGKELIGLIPQKNPFVMIDKLILANEEKTVSVLKIKNDNVLFYNKKFSEAGIVENIAQTAAAGVGYGYKQKNLPTPIGFIAAIKDLFITSLPSEDTEITTEVKVKNSIMDFSIIEGKVSLNNEIIAICEMRIFLKKD